MPPLLVQNRVDATLMLNGGRFFRPLPLKLGPVVVVAPAVETVMTAAMEATVASVFFTARVLRGDYALRGVLAA